MGMTFLKKSIDPFFSMLEPLISSLEILEKNDLRSRQKIRFVMRRFRTGNTWNFLMRST